MSLISSPVMSLTSSPEMVISTPRQPFLGDLSSIGTSTMARSTSVISESKLSSGINPSATTMSETAPSKASYTASAAQPRGLAEASALPLKLASASIGQPDAGTRNAYTYQAATDTAFLAAATARAAAVQRSNQEAAVTAAFATAGFPDAPNADPVMLDAYRSSSSTDHFTRSTAVPSSLRSPTFAWPHYESSGGTQYEPRNTYSDLARTSVVQIVRPARITPGPGSINPAPTFVRTSTIGSSQTPSSALLNGVYQPRVVLKFNGDLKSMTQHWSDDEYAAQRRLVLFTKKTVDHTITASFRPVGQHDRPANSIVLSCIWWAEKNECYVTSVDLIHLLEQLVASPHRFSAEEKNRIRRNLEGFRPLTVSKAKADSEKFFKVIMGFPNPKPRNIEKDVKVYPWRVLGSALKKITSKYSTSPSSHHHHYNSGNIHSYHSMLPGSPLPLPAIYPTLPPVSTGGIPLSAGDYSSGPTALSSIVQVHDLLSSSRNPSVSASSTLPQSSTSWSACRPTASTSATSPASSVRILSPISSLMRINGPESLIRIPSKSPDPTLADSTPFEATKASISAISAHSSADDEPRQGRRHSSIHWLTPATETANLHRRTSRSQSVTVSRSLRSTRGSPVPATGPSPDSSTALADHPPKQLKGEDISIACSIETPTSSLPDNKGNDRTANEMPGYYSTTCQGEASGVCNPSNTINALRLLDDSVKDTPTPQESRSLGLVTCYDAPPPRTLDADQASKLHGVVIECRGPAVTSSVGWVGSSSNSESDIQSACFGKSPQLLSATPATSTTISRIASESHDSFSASTDSDESTSDVSDQPEELCLNGGSDNYATPSVLYAFYRIKTESTNQVIRKIIDMLGTSPGCRTRTSEGNGTNQAHGPSRDSTAVECLGNQPQSFSNGSSQGRGQKRDFEDDGGNYDDDDPGKRQKLGSEPNSILEGRPRRFACPFYQNCPLLYAERKACKSPNWKTVHRVKEHVYRNHYTLRCARCQLSFKRKEELTAHARLPERCALTNPLLTEGEVTEEQYDALRAKKRYKGLSQEQEEEQRWVEMYNIIFPHVRPEDIPSPYLDIELPAASPEILLFLRRNLPQHVEHRLSHRIHWALEMFSTEDRLQIPEMIRQSVSEAIRDVFPTSLPGTLVPPPSDPPWILGSPRSGPSGLSNPATGARSSSAQVSEEVTEAELRNQPTSNRGSSNFTVDLTSAEYTAMTILAPEDATRTTHDTTLSGNIPRGSVSDDATSSNYIDPSLVLNTAPECPATDIADFNIFDITELGIGELDSLS